MMISLIAAIGKNRELGKNNDLLWHIPEDLKHFKEKTKDHAVIMGERTYYSIGKALPNRLNIVLSQNKDLKIDNVVVCDSLDKAFQIGNDYSDEIFVIGGGSVYAQTIDKANKLYLTLVDQTFDADVFFPEFNKYKITNENEWQQSGNLKFKFTEWERK